MITYTQHLNDDNHDAGHSNQTMTVRNSTESNVYRINNAMENNQISFEEILDKENTACHDCGKIIMNKGLSQAFDTEEEKIITLADAAKYLNSKRSESTKKVLIENKENELAEKLEQERIAKEEADKLAEEEKIAKEEAYKNKEVTALIKSNKNVSNEQSDNYKEETALMKSDKNVNYEHSDNRKSNETNKIIDIKPINNQIIDVYIAISKRIFEISNVKNIYNYWEAFKELCTEMIKISSNISEMIGVDTKKEFDLLSQDILINNIGPFFDTCKKILLEHTNLTSEEIDNELSQPQIISMADCQLDINSKDNNDRTDNIFTITQEKWQWRKDQVWIMYGYFIGYEMNKQDKDCLLEWQNGLNKHQINFMIRYQPETTKKLMQNPNCTIEFPKILMLEDNKDLKHIYTKETNTQWWWFFDWLLGKNKQIC